MSIDACCTLASASRRATAVAKPCAELTAPIVEEVVRILMSRTPPAAPRAASAPIPAPSLNMYMTLRMAESATSRCGIDTSRNGMSAEVSSAIGADKGRERRIACVVARWCCGRCRGERPRHRMNGIIVVGFAEMRAPTQRRAVLRPLAQFEFATPRLK